MKEQVLVVFEAVNNIASDEEIMASEGIKHPHCVIITLTKLLEDQNIMQEYKGVLDCTQGHKIYKTLLENRIGRELKAQDDYLMTVMQNYIAKGPGIEKLFISKDFDNQVLINKMNENLEVYKRVIRFLQSKFVKLVNKNKYNAGLNEEGIVLNDFMDLRNGKTYKLVKNVPVEKEPNVEYITPIGLEIVDRILRVKEALID